MKRYRMLIGMLLLVLLLSTSATQAQSPGEDPSVLTLGGSPTETFTYQGYFEDDGKPANGSYDFSFHIYDNYDPAANLISDCQTFEDVMVTDGLFTFNLAPAIGMTKVFSGTGNWIEVRVKPHAEATYFTLPRQPITAVPYAWGLRSGAVIESGSTKPILELRNTYTNTTGQGSALVAYGASPTAATIAGYHEGDAPAIFGRVENIYPAIDGINTGSGPAVAGYGSTGPGVIGKTNVVTSSGVIGTQSGYTYNDLGAWTPPGGFFAGRSGVVGVTKDTDGSGVVGYNRAASEGWAGYFFADNGNGVRIFSPNGTTALVVSGGTKNAAVSTDEGERLLYTEESTEVWFTDYGFGQLSDGEAVITIDPLFAQTVNLDEPYHVFVQAYGDAEIYVTGRTPAQFEVRLRDGDDAVEFSYRLVAKRLAYENTRLAPAPSAVQVEPAGDLP